MRVLVTGANGQVGHELLRALAKSHPPQSPFAGEGGRQANPLPQEGGSKSPPSLAEGVARSAGGCASFEIIPAIRSGKLEDGTACEAIDLADLDGLTEALDRVAPDIIVNAAAYTAVDRAEDEPELAQRINGDAPGLLGTWAKRHRARVVHYSTDYVFDGSATRPYRETDAPNPVSAYGRSKLAGEIALRDSGAQHLILRTAWVYAARGHNFLRTMLRLGAERDELRVVDDQIGAPTPARLIAEVSAQIIAQWNTPASAGRGGATADARAAPTPSGGGMPVRNGIYNLVSSGQTSWCGFARAIFERAQQAGLIERAPVVHAIKTADYPTKAKRPAFSVLDTTRLREAFGATLPDWRTALEEVIGELAGR
ncbi:MAG: dTDP-4-dehydrorhamnose reductase [Rhodanobacteraceae bacterium]|jgi:dTDP-4-dehydrorhamnose reductase|nr:MAG: dTDP-4-dehydrorhamnose reductase [Rhodanobacteraceae bacterium]